MRGSSEHTTIYDSGPFMNARSAPREEIPPARSSETKIFPKGASTNLTVSTGANGDLPYVPNPSPDAPRWIRLGLSGTDRADVSHHANPCLLPVRWVCSRAHLNLTSM